MSNLVQKPKRRKQKRTKPERCRGCEGDLTADELDFETFFCDFCGHRYFAGRVEGYRAAVSRLRNLAQWLSRTTRTYPTVTAAEAAFDTLEARESPS